MRENRTYGSEGGESAMVAPLPLSKESSSQDRRSQSGTNRIDRGRGAIIADSPPSEPYVRFSRIRLSSQHLLQRD